MIEGFDPAPDPSAILSPSSSGGPLQPPAVEALFLRLPQGVKWGLSRMTSFLAATGQPHRSYPGIHIGGTNGKGSVAATVASVLQHAGHRVGLYTSPHLCSFTERFQVAGHPVGARELDELAGELWSDIERHELSFFEAATALAFHLFERRGVDVAVIEVGLGGRLDATNVVLPLITAVTNVAMDHSEYLGETLVEVAREKAGIVKPGVTLLTAETDPRLLSVFADVCDRNEAPFFPLGIEAESMALDIAEDCTAFTVPTRRWGPLRLRTPLVGEHQALNGALSVSILEGLPEFLRPDERALRAGVGGVCWPGRAQVSRTGGRTWVFDVAHNPAGASALASVLECLTLPRPVVLLAAVLGDKNWRSMLPPLLKEVDRSVLTQAPSAPRERRWNPRDAAEVVAGLDTMVCLDFGEAIKRAGELANRGTVVVTGSNHTVGDALKVLRLPLF